MAAEQHRTFPNNLLEANRAHTGGKPCMCALRDEQPGCMTVRAVLRHFVPKKGRNFLHRFASVLAIFIWCKQCKWVSDAPKRRIRCAARLRLPGQLLKFPSNNFCITGCGTWRRFSETAPMQHRHKYLMKIRRTLHSASLTGVCVCLFLQRRGNVPWGK